MNDQSLATPRPANRVRLAFAVLLASTFALASIDSVEAEAAKVSQPSCGKLKKAKKKQCKANALVYRQVKDSYFEGYREDGVEVDTIYCANGRSQDSVKLGGEVFKLGWKVTFAKVKSPKKFTAIIEAKIKGGSFVQSVGRDGSQWQVGYESGDAPQALGDVVRTSAKEQCRTL